MLCTSASLPASRRVFFSLFFDRCSCCRVFCAPLHNITLRWIKLILFFAYIFLYQTREEGKKLRSRWYSIGIGWLNLFFFCFCSAVDGPRGFNATRCLRKHIPISFLFFPRIVWITELYEKEICQCWWCQISVGSVRWKNSLMKLLRVEENRTVA